MCISSQSRRILVNRFVLLLPIGIVLGGISYLQLAGGSRQSLSPVRSDPLHCPEKVRYAGALSQSKYDLLITGCGYSATGYVAQVFSGAGYGIGHETLLENGSANWLAASPQYPVKSSDFRHVILGVRHPLKVVRSCRGSGWAFNFDFDPQMKSKDLLEDFATDSTSNWAKMDSDFQCLEWWVSYTKLGSDIAECWYRSEDMGLGLLLSMCRRAGLASCDKAAFEQAISQVNPAYNRHRTAGEDLTWAALRSKVKNTEEANVLSRARETCKMYFSAEEQC